MPDLHHHILNPNAVLVVMGIWVSVGHSLEVVLTIDSLSTEQQIALINPEILVSQGSPLGALGLGSLGASR